MAVTDGRKILALPRRGGGVLTLPRFKLILAIHGKKEFCGGDGYFGQKKIGGKSA